MNAFRCLRVPATALLRLSVARVAAPTAAAASQRSSSSLLLPQARSISLLSLRRPMLARPSPLAAPGTPCAVAPGSETLDLMGKISAHPGLGSMQIRCGPRDTYNPSHIVRKRRHGFLSRIRTKKGRKLLMRRLNKGRWNLSH